MDNNDENCSRWIDSTLIQYDRSKMKKFHIGYRSRGDNSFTRKIHFATRRNVEELVIVDHGVNYINDEDAYMLPEFIFDIAFLVKFTFLQCGFEQLSRRVNWPSLKALTMDCYFMKDDINGSIENIFSGSPLLESLEIWFLMTKNPVTIASKSLKILNFQNYIDITHDVEISCPNLEELSVFIVDIEDDDDDPPPIFPRKTILNVLSRSPLLHSLKLICYLEPLVIASNSLKELILSPKVCAEITCPNLEKLIWCGSDFEKCKLINLPASCRATLDFVTPELEACDENLARKILVELQPVKELIVCNWFVKVLSALDMEVGLNPLLNVKCLTIDSPYFGQVFGILKGLYCSPVLERLVIKLHVYHQSTTADDHLDLKFENSLIPAADDFTYHHHHLKMVKIIGLLKKDILRKAVLLFVALLLKNARALEKMTVLLEDGGNDFLIEVSRILLSVPKCSRHAIVEVL